VRVAVTGAAGRIGTKVVALLVERGHFVVAIDKNVPYGRDGGDSGPGAPRPHWLTADVTDYRALLVAFEGCDALVHLAAFPGPDGRRNGRYTTTMSFQLQRPARRRLARDPEICQASSVNAIGGAYSRSPRFDYFPLDEAHPSYNETPTACPNGSASSRRRPSPAATMAWSSPACGSTCASRTATGRSR